MSEWFWYAIAAAILYGLHQIFTKLASQHIGDGVGGFVVELTAALIIALYLVYLKFLVSGNRLSRHAASFIQFSREYVSAQAPSRSSYYSKKAGHFLLSQWF